MKKKIKKNIKQRYLFNYFEKNKLILRILIRNLHLKHKKRMKIQQKLLFFNKNSSITQIKNICILTGRSRSISRILKISRIQLRKLISNKNLPGFFKYSW